MRRQFPYAPHTWAWIFTFFCLCSLLFLCTHPMGLNSAIDFQLHDTYFVIANFHIVVFFSFMLSITALFYHWGRNFWIWNGISLFHVLVSGFCIFLIFLYAISVGAMGVPRRYFTFEGVDSFAGLKAVNRRVTILLVIYGLAQILFILHSIVSLVYYLLKRNQKN